jgi:hypothetical protein
MMKKTAFLLRMGGAFVASALVSSLYFAEASPGRPARGRPIQTQPPRGEPIQPAKPVVPPAEGGVQDAAATDAEKDVEERRGSHNYVRVGFDRLAGFEYAVPEYTGLTPPPAPNTNQIPASIKRFDGQRVAVRGFMLPLKVEKGKVTELLLMRDQSMCCFGTIPKINEVVTVKMVGGGAKPVMDQAVTLFGTMRVGEFTENGYLLGIYQLEGEDMDGPGI